jgi:phosphatidylglycerophosphatase A
MNSPSPSDNNGTSDNSGLGGAPIVARVIATVLFVGYIPWASGTLGTLLGLGIYLIPAVQPLEVLLPLIALGLIGGVISAGAVARVEGHRLSRTAELTKARFQPGKPVHPDPSIVVIDEVVGMWISLAALPGSISAAIIAFVLFRTFDILKPFPARQMEHLPGGWGIMMDDVIAGIYANIATRLLLIALHLLLPVLP